MFHPGRDLCPGTEGNRRETEGHCAGAPVSENNNVHREAPRMVGECGGKVVPVAVNVNRAIDYHGGNR